MTKLVKLFLLIFAVFYSLNILAQKTPSSNFLQLSEQNNQRPCISNFDKINYDLNTAESVKTFLQNKIENLKQMHTDLSIEKAVLSPMGKHFTAYQSYKNRKIYNSQIKVNTDNKANIISIFDNSYPINKELDTIFPSLDLIQKQLPLQMEHYKSEQIYFYLSPNFLPALLVTIFESVENHRELIIGQNGELLQQRDLNMYYKQNKKSGKDSLVPATIFLPDPLTSAEKSYGLPYIDDNNGDIPALNDQLIQVNIKVKFDTVFHLENSYVKITEHSAPVHQEVISRIPEFIFNRSQAEFENVNIYYHITQHQNYIQSLGFVNLANYQIHADPHALDGKDQSTFSSTFNPPRLNFGDGGIDDAEDADVIVHEYSHAILFSAAPNTNYGSERESLEEGNCDYFAATYSKSLNTFSSEKVFNWDGHNEFWEGRYCNSAKHYPEDLIGTIHQKGEIWSSTLMEINEIIGREHTDKILIQSVFNYNSNITMMDAAKLFLQADSLLNNGANYNIIMDKFLKRGLISKTNGINTIMMNHENIIIKNTNEFHQGENLNIIFKSCYSGEMNLFDFNGKHLLHKTLNCSNSETIAGIHLNSGIYFLVFENSTEKSQFKLIR